MPDVQAEVRSEEGEYVAGLRVKIEVVDDHDDEVFSSEFVTSNVSITLVGTVMERATKQALDAIEYYINDKKDKDVNAR